MNRLLLRMDAQMHKQLKMPFSMHILYVEKQIIKKFNVALSEHLVKQEIAMTAVRDLDLSFELGSS